MKCVAMAFDDSKRVVLSTRSYLHFISCLMRHGRDGQGLISGETDGEERREYTVL